MPPQSGRRPPVNRVTRVTLLSARFQAAHADGMAALARREFEAFEAAIRCEREILEGQPAEVLARLLEFNPARYG